MREKRLHFVLIPGFGAFDALGQIQYYTGVTPVFRRWRDGDIHAESNVHSGAEHKGIEKSNTSIHYFDNFPTASVQTRAERLRTFLCERIARGEFASEDRVVLIGHSTAGLDIRRLICDLGSEAKERTTFLADGYAVTAQDLLSVIDHVVFLSVPQHGTNIASWTDWLSLFCKVTLGDLRRSVDLSQTLLLEQIEAMFVEGLALSDVDLVLAIRDALNEARLRVGASESETAMAQEAAAELALWLRHLHENFGAVKDLVPESPVSRKRTDWTHVSPAHFSPDQRKEELDIWREHGIAARSYATIAESPLEGAVLSKLNIFSLLHPQTYLRLIMESMESKVDLLFALCYQLCANGNFDEKDIPTPKFNVHGAPPDQITAKDNDGIVNTASMLWPNAEDTILVHCDHMDIVGHFRRVPEKLREGRRYLAYDLLGSDSDFDQSTFESIWCDVFNSSLVRHSTPSHREVPKGKRAAAAAAAQ